MNGGQEADDGFAKLLEHRASRQASIPQKDPRPVCGNLLPHVVNTAAPLMIEQAPTGPSVFQLQLSVRAKAVHQCKCQEVHGLRAKTFAKCVKMTGISTL